jgi:hypothetical protein
MPRRRSACGITPLIPDATKDRTTPATACRSPKCASRSRSLVVVRRACAISSPHGRLSLARAKQLRLVMAAVFALVFLFVVVGGGLLVQVFTSSIDFGSIAALITFMALAWGVFFGLFKMARGWEGEAKH